MQLLSCRFKLCNLYIMLTIAMLIMECFPMKTPMKNIIRKHREDDVETINNLGNPFPYETFANANKMRDTYDDYQNELQSENSKRVFNRIKRKTERLSKWNSTSQFLKYPLQVHMFLNPFPTFGQQYPIYVTMPQLGNRSFILNITVDTQDYLIDVKITNPNINPNGWEYTKKLDYLLRKNGIRVPSIPYRSCYFYRAYAKYFNTKTQTVYIMLASLEHEDQLWAPKYQVGIRVRLSRFMICEPKISLPFCKNPERPVEISPNSYVIFMAEFSSSCMDIDYDYINWSIYDISDQYLLGRLGQTDDLMLRLVPHDLQFIHGPQIIRGFVLRAYTHVFGSITIARCYLRYRAPAVEPIILGSNKRLVNVRKPIFLNGTLSRDPAMPIGESPKGQLLWSCESTDDPRNPYCHKKMSKRVVLKIPAKKLQSGSIYTYKLTMYSSLKNNLNSTTQQLVKGVIHKTFTPHIECHRNCEMGVFAPIDSTNVKAICYDCKEFKPRVEWWVMRDNQSTALLSELNNLAIHYDVAKLTIKLKMFHPRGWFIETEQILKRNDGPQNGTCEISPKMGIESETLFTIDCKGFQTDYPPLVYRYIVKLGVIDSGVPFERYQFYLPATDMIQISICDALDMCVENKLQIDVKPLNFDLTPRSMYSNRELRQNSRLRELLIHVPDMLKRGQWQRAFIRSLASTKYMKSSLDGQLIYSYISSRKIVTSVQLEQMAVLATNMITQLRPLNYRGAALMGKVFKKLSLIFKTTVMDQEWVNRDAYYSLTSMFVFFMYVMGTESERLPKSMCQEFEEQCSLAQQLGFGNTLEFDPLSALRINHWLKANWYLTKCIYYLGILASQRHYSSDRAFSLEKGGICYQINVTEISDVADVYTIPTIDRMQTIFFSQKLLRELGKILSHDSVLFQMISQGTDRNVYWWYPEALPSETHVLNLNAYSPEKYLPFGKVFFVNNPLVFTMNITNFSENPEFANWIINGSITSYDHIHYYKITLYARNLLAVRIVSCTDNMRISLRLHFKPKITEIRKTACFITPHMKGKRIWMSNYCPVRSPAYVSVLKTRPKKTKSPWKNTRTRMDSPKLSTKRALNYTILLETYQCSYWNNKSLNPGWSTEFCRTDYDPKYGTAVKCSCDLLGVLSSRIFPIAAERQLELIIHPILEINWYLLIIFLALFLALLAVLSTYMRGLVAHQRHSLMKCNLKGEEEKVDNLQIRFQNELLITIVTGGQTFAGSTSNIVLYFKSIGREQLTYHIQQDPTNPRLLRNSTNKITLSRGPIHLPTRLAIGIERSGRYPKWFCRSIAIADLERNVEQFFPLNRWIEHGHTRFIRSPYYTDSRYDRPPYSWFQRFCHAFEELFINWYAARPLFGPWLTSASPYAMNRFERSCIFICKLSLSIAWGSIWFGRHVDQGIDQMFDTGMKDFVNFHLIFVIGVWSYVISLLIHVFFEILIFKFFVKRV